MILLKWLIWRKKFHFSTLFCELQFWKMILLEHLQKLIFVQIYFLHSCNSVSMAFDQSEICPFFFFKWWRILKKGQKEKKNILFFFFREIIGLLPGWHNTLMHGPPFLFLKYWKRLFWLLYQLWDQQSLHSYL